MTPSSDLEPQRSRPDSRSAESAFAFSLPGSHTKPGRKPPAACGPAIGCTWTGRFESSHFQTDLPLPNGYTDVAPPVLVSAPRAANLISGEYL